MDRLRRESATAGYRAGPGISKFYVSQGRYCERVLTGISLSF